MNHSRIHTGGLKSIFNYLFEILISIFVETPFKCELCSVQFTTKKSLKAHLDRQCRMPNLTCFVCGKSFAKQSYVTNHIKYVLFVLYQRTTGNKVRNI